MRAQQGFFLIERTCPTCGGAGRVIDEPLQGLSAAPAACSASARSTSAIPAGVEDGTRIRLAGEGEAGLRGAPAGDLYVTSRSRPHPIFQRDGANIFVRVPLRDDAGGARRRDRGAERSMAGKAKVTIPAGTQAGDQFRLRGKGFSVLRSAARGDMYVQVAVETPQNLTRRQRELLEEFESEAARPGKTSPEARASSPRWRPSGTGSRGSGPPLRGRPADRLGRQSIAGNRPDDSTFIMPAVASPQRRHWQAAVRTRSHPHRRPPPPRSNS